MNKKYIRSSYYDDQWLQKMTSPLLAVFGLTRKYSTIYSENIHYCNLIMFVPLRCLPCQNVKASLMFSVGFSGWDKPCIRRSSSSVSTSLMLAKQDVSQSERSIDCCWMTETWFKVSIHFNITRCFKHIRFAKLHSVDRLLSKTKLKPSNLY